jgi:hypothetical protein
MKTSFMRPATEAACADRQAVDQHIVTHCAFYGARCSAKLDVLLSLMPRAPSKSSYASLSVGGRLLVELMYGHLIEL